MENHYRLGAGLGNFDLGVSISNYVKSEELVYKGWDSDTHRHNYSAPLWGIDFYTNEGHIIETITSEKSFIVYKQQLIGMHMHQIISLLGEPTSVEILGEGDPEELVLLSYEMLALNIWLVDVCEEVSCYSTEVGPIVL